MKSACIGAILATTLLPATTATAAAGANTTKITDNCSGHKYCVNLWESEDGYRTTTPFTHPINPSGGINAGHQYVYCKKAGDWVGPDRNHHNHWWLKTDLDWANSGMPWQNQYISAYGSTGPNDQAVDINGRTIPTC